MAIKWTDSAEKHYPIADALHAIKYQRVFLPGFDVNRQSGEVVDLVVGPARDGPILEVFVHRREPRTVFIFHVLHLRPKTKARAQEIIKSRQQKEGDQ